MEVRTWKKRKCPNNSSHPVVSWGETSSGSSRFHCKTCKITFTWQRSDKTQQNRFPWFEFWLRGLSVKSIAKINKRNKNTIIKTVYWYLDHPPKLNPVPNPNCHAILDGTYFKRENCLIVYWDKNLKRIQWSNYTSGEKTFEVLHDLRTLKRKGVILASVTSDGSGGIEKALGIEYPNIPHQRCLVHLKRQTLAFITKNPKTNAGKEIRPLMQRLTKIDNLASRDQWLKDFRNWRIYWEDFLKERSYSDDGTKEWWYTHKSLRRVRASVKNAIPNLFHYLDDKSIPRDGNGLEGRFSSFKQHYRQHRGLSKKRREGYIAWYLTVVVNKDSPTRN